MGYRSVEVIVECDRCLRLIADTEESRARHDEWHVNDDASTEAARFV